MTPATRGATVASHPRAAAEASLAASNGRNAPFSPAALLRRFFGRDPQPGRPELPAAIGRYRVLRMLGVGGMGKVYEAEDDVLGRRVAVKTLKSTDESSRRRFWREARAAARLNHPHVCQLYEVGEDRNGPFLAMELLTGEPLSDRLARGPLPAEEAVTLGLQMLSALAALHAAGIVHRDLKPSNVFLTAHGCRILDFGLARALPREIQLKVQSDPALTSPDALVGSPRYMAPEQVLGHEVGPRSDLFATGAVLYEALAGRPAFSGRSLVEVLSATLNDPPPPLSAAHVCFEPVLRRALAKDPAERHASAAEMAEALRAAAPPSGSSLTDAIPRSAAALAAARRTEKPSGPLLVGRESELAYLEKRFAAATEGSGGVVFVTGERGSGKTALVGELLRRVRSQPAPATVVAGRCVESHGPGEPFLPFLDALGRLLTSPGREVAVKLVRTWAPTIAMQMPAEVVPDPDGDLQRRIAGATRERLVREGGDFMEAAARHYPLLMLLEDLQWADAASVDMLAHLGRRIARQRSLIVGTFRSADVDAANAPMRVCALDLRAAGIASELALPPLAPLDVAQWLDARFAPNDFPGELATALHTRCEGHPLFLRSLLELLAERGQIRHVDGRYRLAAEAGALDLEPSKDLADLARAHLDTLPAADRALLSLASVAGKDFLASAVAALAGDDELDVEERLLRLCRVHRVLEPAGDVELPGAGLTTRYRFAHGLFRGVLYDELSARRRVELHGRIARHLQPCVEALPLLAREIADHYERAREPLMAARLRTRAGDNAARRFAPRDAAEQYTCALELLEKAPNEQRQPMASALHGRLGRVRHTLGRFDEAAAEFEQMREGARATGSAALEAEALTGLADALFFAQRVDESAARAREALAAAERTGSEPDRRRACCRLAQVLACEGRLSEAAADLDELIASERAAGVPPMHQALTSRGFVHYWRSEYALAEPLLAEAAVTAEERGDGFDLLLVRMFAGLSAANLGRMSEALAVFESAAAVAERNADRFWLPRLVSHQGWIHRELLAPQRAGELDAAALALARESPSAWAPEIDALLSLLVDGVHTGQSEASARLLAQIEQATHRSQWMPWMNELRLAAATAEHWSVRGESAAAIAAADRLQRLARRLGARTYVAAAERVHAEAVLADGGSVEDAAAQLAAALAELRPFGARLEGWKAGRTLGRLLARLARPADARAAFADAAADARAIAAGTADDELRRGFLGSAPILEILEGAGQA